MVRTLCMLQFTLSCSTNLQICDAHEVYMRFMWALDRDWLPCGLDPSPSRAGVLCNCISHALTTEKEEIMGLLLGDTVQTEAGDTVTHLSLIHI